METRLLADLERLQLHAPCESTDVHALHYWGLFSMLNQLVRATIHSFAHGRRAAFEQRQNADTVLAGVRGEFRAEEVCRRRDDIGLLHE